MDEIRNIIGNWMLDVMDSERLCGDAWAVRAGVTSSIITRMVAVKTRTVRETGTIPGTQSLYKLASVVSLPLDLGVLSYSRTAPQQQNYGTDWLSHEDTHVWSWATNDQHIFILNGLPFDQNKKHNPAYANLCGKTRWDFAGADVINDPLWRHHKSDMDAHVPIENFVFEYSRIEGRHMRVRTDALPVFKRNKFHGYRGTAIILNLSVMSRSTKSRSTNSR